MRAWQSLAFSVWFSSLVRKGLPQGCLTSRIMMHTSAGKQTDLFVDDKSFIKLFIKSFIQLTDAAFCPSGTDNVSIWLLQSI